MKRFALLFCTGLILLVQSSETAVITFDGLPDGTVLTTQYSGLSFFNATILTAGLSLNEFEFPPRSGANVVSDNGGPITILFSTPVLSFSGYFTYLNPLNLIAFDSSNKQIATSHSLFSNNLACPAGPPCSGHLGSATNELLSGDPGGGSSS